MWTANLLAQQAPPPSSPRACSPVSTAVAIFAANTPLPAVSGALPGGALDVGGDDTFAGLVHAETAEAPTQSASGFLKAPPQIAVPDKDAQTVVVSLVIDAPVAQVKGVVEAVIVAEGAADTEKGVSDAEAAPVDPAPEAAIADPAWQPLPTPTPAPTPVATVPQPASFTAGPPTSEASAPPVPSSAATDPAVAGEAPAAPAATGAAAAQPTVIDASMQRGGATAQAQAKSTPEEAEAPLAPALKAEAREGRQASENSTPTGAANPASNEASAPAAPASPTQAKEAATDASTTKASAADQTSLDAPADAASSPKTDSQTAATPAAAREAAQPQTTQAALTSNLSRATVETTAQMSAQILRRLEGRSTHFDMVLTPEALGRVEVSVDIDADGQLAARLAFDNPAAALDLRGRADELRRQLEDAGFRLTDDSLSFTDRDSSRSGDQRQDGAARRFASAARVANEADQIVPAPRWMSMNLTPDRVDVRV